MSAQGGKRGKRLLLEAKTVNSRSVAVCVMRRYVTCLCGTCLMLLMLIHMINLYSCVILNCRSKLEEANEVASECVLPLHMWCVCEWV